MSRPINGVYIPNSLKELSYNAFDINSSFVIDGVAYLDGWVVGLNGPSVADLSNARGIARGALRGAFCGKLILPSCMTSIDSYMFENSSFNEVIIPDSVTNIAGGAFGNCKIFERLTIGAGVTWIDLSNFICMKS